MVYPVERNPFTRVRGAPVRIFERYLYYPDPALPLIHHNRQGCIYNTHFVCPEDDISGPMFSKLSAHSFLDVTPSVVSNQKRGIINN